MAAFLVNGDTVTLQSPQSDQRTVPRFLSSSVVGLWPQNYKKIK